MKGSLVQEYRGQITLADSQCVVTVTASSPADVQSAIHRLLNGKARFEANQNSTILVFGEDHFDGSLPIGWIVNYEVPKPHNIQTVTEHRLSLLQKKAA